MQAGLPVLGACQGAQMIAHILGAEVGPAPHGQYEFGYYPIALTEAGQQRLPAVAKAGLVVPQAHFHQFSLPAGAAHLARSDLFENQAFSYGQHILGFQFHAEVGPAQFRRWQEGNWGQAMFGQPGSQDRQTQDRLAAVHADATDRWFCEVITDLFGHTDVR